MVVCCGAVDWGTALQARRSWVHWNFHWQSFRLHYGAGVESTSNRNEYQKYFLGGKGDRFLGLMNLPLSCAEFHKVREPQPPGTLRACPGLYRDCYTLPNGDWKHAKRQPYLSLRCYPGIYLVVVSRGRLTSRCWMFWSRFANWPLPNESIQHYFRTKVPGRCDICSMVTFVVTEYQGQWGLLWDKKKRGLSALSVHKRA
jgi:hypothetical protein